MSAPVQVTPEHIERAYAQTRKHDPPPLEVLRSHWSLYCCIRNRALGIAQGQVLPPEPVATPPPAPSTRPAAPPMARRRDDRPHPFDPRAAAAGEYVHPDPESDNP